MEDKRYAFIISTIQKAGELLLEAMEGIIEVRSKNNDVRDIVTNIDIEISDFISKAIRKSFSDEVIYSEEASDVDLSSGSFWAIDPIDGTANFSRNIPHFAIVLAYVEAGIPVAGAIYNLKTRELFSFQKGQGAFLNGQSVSVSKIKDLSAAYVLLRIGKNKQLWDWGAKASAFLLAHANKTANFGASALDMCFVGAGRTEACIYGNLTAIDISAAIGFVREAGGIVVIKDKTVVAVNNTEILTALKAGIDLK